MGKERRGSSLGAIKKFINQKFGVVPTETTSGLVRRTIKNLKEGGRIISGGPAGTKGSGSFKIAPEEKTRLVKDAKMKDKKAATPANKQVMKAPVKKVKKAKKAGDGKVVSGKKQAAGKKSKVSFLRS